jgi:Spy/CpxP family protein refolding chaperone
MHKKFKVMRLNHLTILFVKYLNLTKQTKGETMNINKIFIAFIFLAILPLTYISAQKGKEGEKRERNFIQQLNLSEEQKTEFKNLKFNFEEKMIDLQTELKKNRLEFRKMLNNDNLNDDDVYKLAEKGSKIRNEMMNSKISFWLDVNKILTKEQRDIWKRNFEKTVMQNDNSFEKRRDLHSNERRERLERMHGPNYRKNIKPDEIN